ncbi:MAG TPA: hypothetical protein PKD24_16285 [Pyrinomonadaceae bacterium]|nr:hypothetical protein [Pyrinomonadaceae bacterium]HMP66925.1 hypothetical protein [Pyrinomonadaceae bacterium]
MISTLLQIAVLIAAMIFGSFMGTIITNLGGLPGALIALKANWESRWQAARWIIGFIFTMVGQSYVALAWVALVVSAIRSFVNVPDVWAWPVWIVGFFTAISVAAGANRQSIQEQRLGGEIAEIARKGVQYQALPGTGIASVIGYFVFVFFPNFMSLMFGWLPFVD